jgi:hypothetical protein
MVHATAGMVHVTNMTTPGSDNPTRGVRPRCARRQRRRAAAAAAALVGESRGRGRLLGAYNRVHFIA